MKDSTWGPLRFLFFWIGSAECPGDEFLGVATLGEASSDILERWARKLSGSTEPTRHIGGCWANEKVRNREGSRKIIFILHPQTFWTTRKAFFFDVRVVSTVTTIHEVDPRLEGSLSP